MSNEITFDENKYKIKSRSILGESQVPAMTKYLLTKGIVKSEKTAHMLLLTVTGIFFLAAIYVFAVFVLDVKLFNKTPTQTPEQIQRMQENRERIEKIRQQRQNNINNTTNN